MRLGMRLENDKLRFDRLDCYDQGDHPIPPGHRKAREAYRRFQQMARSNYCGLVVESLSERIRVLGFSSGSGGNRKLDATAWGIWQANSLDADAGVVHHKMFALSRAYVMVSPNPLDKSKPYITPEDPRQVIHEYDPVIPRKVVAALKVWFDPTENTTLAIIYTPDFLFYFRAVGSTISPDGTVAGTTGSVAWRADGWEIDSDEGDGGYAANPLGEVPIVPFINRRERGGQGEFEDVTDIQDRINVTVLDRLVIQSTQAYRQRWMKGVEIDDTDGNANNPFDIGADLMLAVPEGKDVDFGEFQPTDIGQIVSASGDDVRTLAAITRTPPHYLLADVANISGEALAAVEVGLTSKARDRIAECSEGWEDVMRKAGVLAGVTIADDCSVDFMDPERHTLAELSDAAVKWESAGVPWRSRMKLLGFDPQSIDRMEEERIADAKLAAMATPLGVAPGSAPGTVQVPLTAPGSPTPGSGSPSSATPAQPGRKATGANPPSR